MDSPLRLDRFFHLFLQPLQSMLVTHLSWIEKINVQFHFVLNIEKIVISDIVTLTLSLSRVK